jgi:predicted RNA-binding protein with PUA-like domain
MAHWLVKTEPSTYAFEDLTRERRTAWTGVANPQAQLNLKLMRAGDEVAIYHTGAVKAAVGLGTVARAAYPDPTGQGKLVCVDLAAGRPLAAPVTLAALKEAKAFAGSPLVTQGRLSVVPLTAAQWKALLAMGG